MTASAMAEALADYARRLAPEVDRLAICVHEPASKREEGRAAFEAAGLPRPTIIVVVARHLAAGALTFDDLRLLNRYVPIDKLQALFDAHVSGGFLVRTGDAAYAPTDEVRDAARLVLRIQSEEAEKLWRPEGESTIARAAELAAAHVDAAATAIRTAPASADPVPAFAGQVATAHVMPDTPAGRLLGRVTELRYLRSDAHAAALAAHGLAAAPPPELRDRVEDDTNARNGAYFAGVAPADRDEFLAALVVLGGGARP